MLTYKPTLHYYRLKDYTYSTEPIKRTFLNRIRNMVKHGGFTYSLKELVDILKEDGFIIYGTINNRLVTVMIVLYDSFKSDTNYIVDTITVSNKFRNKGIGRIMMNTIIELAIKDDMDNVCLLVKNGNPIKKFYESLGFTDTKMGFKEKILEKQYHKSYREMKLQLKSVRAS